MGRIVSEADGGFPNFIRNFVQLGGKRIKAFEEKRLERGGDMEDNVALAIIGAGRVICRGGGGGGG